MTKDFQDQEYVQLLERIAQGDEQAFAKLYDIFWPELLGFISQKVTDVQVAEDMVHDLFMSLWNRRASLSEIESIPAYLYSASRYMSFHHYRKNVLLRSEGEPTEDIVDGEQPLEDRLYYRYLLDLVDREIENLPEKCKQVFKLSRHSHLTNNEIAQKLAISESTVENQINKAIKRLREISKENFMFFIFFL